MYRKDCGYRETHFETIGRNDGIDEFRRMQLISKFSFLQVDVHNLTIPIPQQIGPSPRR